MGDIADGLIDGSFDEHTGEYLGEAVGYLRTLEEGYYNTIEPEDPRNEEKYSKSTREIRKELAILIKSRISKLENSDRKHINIVTEESRKEMNKKYGKGWREQY